MSFQCDKCGACCIAITPDLDRGDGICKHLTPENLCDIYEDRPTFCRVDDTYEIFKDSYSREEYYQLAHECCKQLKQLIK